MAIQVPKAVSRDCCFEEMNRLLKLLRIRFFVTSCLAFTCPGLSYAIEEGISNAVVNFTGEKQLREISIALTVPNPAWTLSIREVWIVGDELWVISRLTRVSDMAAQVITTVSDKITIMTPNLPIKHYVVGKTWNWGGQGGHVFIESRDVLKDDLRSGERIYKKSD